MVRRKPQCAEACDRWLNVGESIAYSPLGFRKFWFTERKFNYCFKSLPVVPSEILFLMAYSYTWRLRPKGVRTVLFSGFCNIKGSGFYAFKLRKELGLRYSLLFALNTVSLRKRMQYSHLGNEKEVPFLMEGIQGHLFWQRWNLGFDQWSVPGFGVCTCAYLFRWPSCGDNKQTNKHWNIELERKVIRDGY